jgi:hypothetical protein
MNTTSVKIEDGFNYFHNEQYLLKSSLKRILAALKPKTRNATSRYTVLPYQKKSMENFPAVPNIHGISYGQNERDRLFYR